MENRIFIDGKEVTIDAVNLDDFTIETGLNTQTKTVTKNLSYTITFRDDTFEYLKEFFFKNCDGLTKELEVTFVTTICGGLTFQAKITAESVTLNARSIDVLLETVDKGGEAYNELDSTLWFDNGFHSAYTIPIMYFANQPDYLIYVLMLLLDIVKSFFQAVEDTIETICEVVTLSFGNCELGLTKAVFSRIDTWIAGLGGWGTSPLVREILTYQINRVGLNFVSSILNNPNSIYWNMTFFSLERGVTGNHKDISDIKRQNVLLENAPLWTVIEMLNNLAIPFEADYRIIGNTLYFEDKYFFDNLPNDQLINLNNLCDQEELSIVYNVNNNKAYGQFEFQQDAMDAEGNKSLSYYKTKVDFNNPGGKGKTVRLSPFSGARFMFDQFTFEDKGFFDWERRIDEFRDGKDNIYDEFKMNNTGLIRERDLILSGSMTSIPKLLVLEPNFNRSDAKVIRKPFAKKDGKQFWVYNYPMLYKETLDRVLPSNQFVEGEKGMLRTFADKANPILMGDKLSMSNVSIDCDCDIADKLLNNIQEVYIQTEFGKAIVDNADISFKSGKVSINVKESRIICN